MIHITDTQYTVFTIPTAKRDWSNVTHIGLGINLSETDSACSIYMTLLVDTADNRIKDTTLVSRNYRRQGKCYSTNF